MKQQQYKDKKDSSVEVIPKTIKKTKLIKFHLKKPAVVNIDAYLKRIYSITN